MKPFRYQIFVQWCDKRACYQAFTPTIMEHIHHFLPGHPTLSHGETVQEAVNGAMWQAIAALKASKKRGILPPDEDIRQSGWSDEDLIFDDVKDANVNRSS